MRLNPLNLPKIEYFAKWIKGVKFVPSFLLFYRVLMIQTHIVHEPRHLKNNFRGTPRKT